MSSVEQYADTGYYLVINGASTSIGAYEFAEDCDIESATLRFFHKKSGAYSYALTLSILGSANGAVIATSDVLTFSDEVTGQTTEDFLVECVFDFSDKYEVKAGETYYLRLDQTGYTRPARPNENTAYLSVWSDWLEPLNDSNTAAARIAFGVRK